MCHLNRAVTRNPKHNSAQITQTTTDPKPNIGRRQRTYSAARNFGATLDGKAIGVSSTKRLEDALIAAELCHLEGLMPTVFELHADFAKNARVRGPAARRRRSVLC